MTLSFTPATGSGYAGTTLQLVARVTGTTNTNVLWFSTDPSRVGVGLRNGLVSYIFPGVAIICSQLEINANVKFCGTFTTLGSAVSGNVLQSMSVTGNDSNYVFPNIENFPKGDGKGGYVGRHNILIQ